MRCTLTLSKGAQAFLWLSGFALAQSYPPGVN